MTDASRVGYIEDWTHEVRERLPVEHPAPTAEELKRIAESDRPFLEYFEKVTRDIQNFVPKKKRKLF